MWTGRKESAINHFDRLMWTQNYLGIATYLTLIDPWIIVVCEGRPSSAGPRIDTSHMVEKRVCCFGEGFKPEVTCVEDPGSPAITLTPAAWQVDIMLMFAM